MRARIHLSVSPGAKRTGLVEVAESNVRVRVGAPPIDGKANRELLAFLARCLTVSPSSVALVRGANGRHKVVEVAGLSTEEALSRLQRQLEHDAGKS